MPSATVISARGSWTELRTAAGLAKGSQSGRPQWLLDVIAAIPDPADLLDDPPLPLAPDGSLDPYAHLTIQDLLRIAECMVKQLK